MYVYLAIWLAEQVHKTYAGHYYRSDGRSETGRMLEREEVGCKDSSAPKNATFPPGNEELQPSKSQLR